MLAVSLAAFVTPRALGGPSGAEARGQHRQPRPVAALYRKPRAARSVVQLIRCERPDVVSLQEVTPQVAAALDEAGIDRLLPERIRDVRRRGGSGSAVYARLPLDRSAAQAGP